MSVRIDSNSDRLEIDLWSTFGNTTGNAYTIMGWFKLINARLDNSIFGAGNGSSDFICYGPVDGLTLTFFNGGGDSAQTYALSTNTWYHLAFTRAASGGATLVYVDGTQRISDTNFNPVSGTPPKLTIGYDSYGGDYIDGELRGWRVWQTALSSTEINTEKGSTTPVAASPWADWDLPNAAGAATDRSGNGRSLTVSGLTDGASDPAIYAAGATPVASRFKKNTIHPGKHPDRFGKRLTTRRNRAVTSLAAITGTASPTLGNDTSAATGTPVVTGSVARALGNDTSAATGTPVISGSLASTLGNDTSAASGAGLPSPSGSRPRKQTIHPGKHPDKFGKRLKTRRNIVPTNVITGSANVTAGDDTLSASGAVLSNPMGSRPKKRSIHPGHGPYNPLAKRRAPGNFTTTLATIIGTASPTLGNDTSVASGTPVVTGSLAKNLGNDTSSAAGSPVVSGSLAKTLGNDTSAATGTPVVSGTSGATAGNDTSNASGKPVVTGSSAATTGSDTSAAAGKPVITGTASPTNGNDTSQAAGGSIYGSAAITLGNDTSVARGDAGTGSNALGGGGWAGTAGESRRKRDEIEEILEAAEAKAETILSAPALEGARTQEAKALERDVNAIQEELKALQAKIAAAQDRAIRSEIERLTNAIQATEAELQALEIEDENAAIALILGMVL